MVFTKRLRDAVRGGHITSSIRIWKNPRVKAGALYPFDAGGQIQIDSIEPISLQEITQDLAIECGFPTRSELLKVAQHGSGTNVYLIRFHYIPR